MPKETDANERLLLEDATSEAREMEAIRPPVYGPSPLAGLYPIWRMYETMLGYRARVNGGER